MFISCDDPFIVGSRVFRSFTGQLSKIYIEEELTIYQNGQQTEERDYTVKQMKAVPLGPD
jgi:hypothetical protein